MDRDTNAWDRGALNFDSTWIQVTDDGARTHDDAVSARRQPLAANSMRAPSTLRRLRIGGAFRAPESVAATIRRALRQSIERERWACVLASMSMPKKRSHSTTKRRKSNGGGKRKGNRKPKR